MFQFYTVFRKRFWQIKADEIIIKWFIGARDTEKKDCQADNVFDFKSAYKL